MNMNTSENTPRLCLIEDDAIMGESLCDRFDLEGMDCDWYKTAGEALAGFDQQHYSVAISDIRLPDFSGDDLYGRLQKTGDNLPPFIFITGHASIDTAVRLLKQGAEDYITKPFDLDQLIEKIHGLIANQPVPLTHHGLGLSAGMRRITDMLPRLALHASTILITGESGVGKEKVARELHHRAGHGDQPFIAINCGAITESLMESELFGHEKGAFTGAERRKTGVFEQADGGTLFLDEIGEMPLAMQVKLLRVIQDRSIVRVGGETSIPVDVRLVCATHRDLKQMVEEGSFREDLFYRINVIQLKIPPLRDRKEDILWFAELFMSQFATEHHMKPKMLNTAAELAMLDYPWPGNVRELKHAIERAYILSAENILTAEALFEENLLADNINVNAETDLNHYLLACERHYILNALKSNQWHMGNTANALGISTKNLWEKRRKLDISISDKES